MKHLVTGLLAATVWSVASVFAVGVGGMEARPWVGQVFWGFIGIGFLAAFVDIFVRRPLCRIHPEWRLCG